MLKPSTNSAESIVFDTVSQVLAHNEALTFAGAFDAAFEDRRDIDDYFKTCTFSRVDEIPYSLLNPDMETQILRDKCGWKAEIGLKLTIECANREVTVTGFINENGTWSVYLVLNQDNDQEIYMLKFWATSEDYTYKFL